MQNNDIDFLYEVGSLRFIQRTWRQFIGSDFANVAEHTLRVVWIAIVIAKNETNVNFNKVVKMALVHDLAETRTGDVNYLSRQYVNKNDQSAIQDILRDTSINDEFLSIWQEYEDRQTIESKIVKDADNIDVDLELMEQKARGSSLLDKWFVRRKKSVASKLYTKTARELWASIQKTDPDNWHIKAPNRFKVGDWK